VIEDVKQWQNRPLEELYPIVYLDALIPQEYGTHVGGITRRLKMSLLSVLWMGYSERPRSLKHAGKVEICLAHMDTAIQAGRILTGGAVRDFHAPNAAGTNARISERLVMERHVRANTKNLSATMRAVEFTMPISPAVDCEVF